MSSVINISLVGVGGQGILLASDIIAKAAMLAGLDAKKSEVHGMAQRGGSVISEIRFGEKVYSPLIPAGTTDYLVSSEKLEALRYAHFLSPDGLALVNDQLIVPVTVSSGQHPMVDDLDARLKSAFPKLEVVPALDIARDLGSLRVVNVVMTGALSTHLKIPEDAWLQAIRDSVKERFVELNLKAFEAGRALTPVNRSHDQPA